MASEQLIGNVVNEMGIMEQAVDDEMDLCIVCCSKVKNERDCELDNNRQLLSRNLNVFYLLRKVFHVSGIQLKETLINCGNPVEWIKLCDKCTELTEQAEELFRKSKVIERELNCVHNLIRDKAECSIDREVDRTLVEEVESAGLTKRSGQIWKRFRSHVAAKCHSGKTSSAAEKDSLTNPFSEGDKLAHYLTTQKTSTTAILPNELEQLANLRNEKDKQDDGHFNFEEINTQAPSSLPPPSSPPIEIKIELTPHQLDPPLEEPPLAGHSLDHRHENLLIDSLLEELDDEPKVEVDVKEEEEMEVDGYGQNKLVDQEEKRNNDKVDDEEDKANWNWEPEEDEDNKIEVDEVDVEDNEALNVQMSKVTSLPPPPPPVWISPKKKKLGSFLEKGRPIRTADGKWKCRHCDQIFASNSGLNGHERDKHSKTPGAFKCDICGASYNSRDYLRKHVKRSHEQPQKNRKMIRTQDGKFKCRDCDQTFGSMDGVCAHEREKHTKTPGGFVCDICGKAFNSNQYLRGHKFKTHKLKSDGTLRTPKVLPRDHICDQCGKAFMHAHELKEHIKFVHEKNFDIKCDLCGVGKRDLGSLQKHMFSIHPGDPLTKKLIEEEGLNCWRCPVAKCSALYLKEQGVKGHLKGFHGKSEEEVEGMRLEAEGGDPFAKATCGKCGKVCANRIGLAAHQLKHRNEGRAEEYFCEICGKGFIRSNYLDAHLKNKHFRGAKKGTASKGEK